jgi:hypothetical protein
LALACCKCLTRISHKPSVGRSADTAETSLCATLSADTLFPSACGADSQSAASRLLGTHVPIEAWVFRGTRLPVATVIENLEDLSVEEVMEQFDATREQIVAVLDFVAQSLNASAPEQPPAPVNAHSF